MGLTFDHEGFSCVFLVTGLCFNITLGINNKIYHLLYLRRSNVESTPIVLLTFATLIACGDKASDTGSGTETDTVTEEGEEEEASVILRKASLLSLVLGEYDSIDGVGTTAHSGSQRSLGCVKMGFSSLEIPKLERFVK